ncbi:hypothetical protein TgHK011_004968 [Trichoderma gracile]|nr:hypothetical protein TgHK011_004968 [Trichoderma gracile]
MVRPSMSVMQSFCLMVLAKQLANGTCWSFNAKRSLLGIIVRLAISMGLHKSPVAILVWITHPNGDYNCDSFPTICSLIARVSQFGHREAYIRQNLQYNADIKCTMTTTLEQPGCRSISLRAVVDMSLRLSCSCFIAATHHAPTLPYYIQSDTGLRWSAASQSSFITAIFAST